MLCEAFESRLHLLLDRHQQPELDNQLRAHALGCHSCQRMLDAQENLFAGLDLFEMPAEGGAPSDVLVRDLLRAESTPTSTKRRRRWIGPLMLVAASFVVVMSGPSLSEWTKPNVSPLTVAAEIQPAVVMHAVTPGQEPFVDSAGQAGHYLGDFASSLPNQLTVDSLSRLEPPVLSKGLRPLATSFNTALTVIRRTMPGGRDIESGSPQAFAHGVLAPHV